MSTVTAKTAREHRITIPSLAARKKRKERIAMLTAYDFTFASIFDAADIDIEALRKSGLARKKSLPVKLLGNGQIDRAVKISVHACSKTAKEMVEKAGGEVLLIKA